MNRTGGRECDWERKREPEPRKEEDVEEERGVYAGREGSDIAKEELDEEEECERSGGGPALRSA